MMCDLLKSVDKSPQLIGVLPPHVGHDDPILHEGLDFGSGSILVGFKKPSNE